MIPRRRHPLRVAAKLMALLAACGVSYDNAVPVSIMDSQFPENRPGPDGNPSAGRALTVLAATVVVMFVVVGVVRLVSRALDSSSVGVADVGEFAIILASGLACGGLLFGLSAALRLLRELHASLIRVEQFQYERRTSSGGAYDADSPSHGVSATAHDPKADEDAAEMNGSMQAMIRLLEDIRDNSLLSEEQRREKRRRVADEEIEDAQTLIRSLSAERDFVQARKMADKTQRKYPSDGRVDALVVQVEEARERWEAGDVSEAIRQVDDLISVSAWPRARELAQQLQARYPDSAEARQLLLRIERDHKAFQEEQCRRMRAEIQRLVSRRRWEEALVAARTFIERFPGSEEAQAMRLELPTLKTNAEIDIRQKLEAEIMDLVKHGRYIEATELATKVIEQYPGSPQAEALRTRLGRLRELAHDPKAPPARIRLDD